MNSYRKKQLLTVAVLFIMIAGLSIGFSALSKVLNIETDISVNPNKELIKSARQFAKSKNLRLILLSANPAHKRLLGSEAVYMPKVEEWLSYFKYASYVLTDSFHACVFSTQFNRQFAAFVEERNIKRISSVLHLLGIENRMIQNATYADLAKVYDGEIDFTQVNDKLKELQKDSGDWLLKQLSTGKSGEDERQ